MKILLKMPSNARSTSPISYSKYSKMAQADAQIQTLEAALAELNAANGKTKDSDSYKFEGTFDNLTAFTGYWREMKANKDPSRYENMVDSYNSAVR